ncbi:thioredoxin family protein [Nocardioides cavernae]|uniref:Thioredoxin family protein n=1 Tax=Nocardioides cavernae TaxID=1921566 RepID=A0ABR8N5N7_9ACTN|nr:thioredoxin family protein [Nocardioides cavernae]MBD3923465.1 thioredoxin family protein [Nocardioides cavernae]MBM7511609.1 thiol-disulfide isomerase/thioredoxin [Nocardioides cavernae]
MTTGAWIVVVAVVLALSFGLRRLATDGRFRGTRLVRRPGTDVAPDVATDEAPDTRPGAELVAAVGQQLGERATLLQFSSAFCAPCRATRRVLGEVTGLVDGVAHVEIDAEHHLEATRTLGILRTPTTLVLDAAGAEVTRATGAPTRDQVLTALARV